MRCCYSGRVTVALRLLPWQPVLLGTRVRRTPVGSLGSGRQSTRDLTQPPSRFDHYEPGTCVERGPWPDIRKVLSHWQASGEFNWASGAYKNLTPCAMACFAHREDLAHQAMEIGRGCRGQCWIWRAVVPGAILVTLSNSWVDVLSMLVLCLALNYLGWRKVEISWALPAALLFFFAWVGVALSSQRWPQFASTGVVLLHFIVALSLVAAIRCHIEWRSSRRHRRMTRGGQRRDAA